MGILAKQAYSNSINIVIGIIAGAINTIYILPRAFEAMPEDWGLVKILLSYAIISAHIFGFGIHNIVIREYSRYQKKVEKSALMGLVLLLGIVGVLLIVFTNFITDGGIVHFINEDDTKAISENLYSYFLLSISVILSQVFTGFIVSNHKTPMIQLVNETFLKSFYLIISVVYLITPYSFDLYLKLFTLSYIISLIIYIIYSLKLGLTINFNFSKLNLKETITYGMYTVLDKGAAIIVGNLDLIMIGLLLNLENVAFYTLAFYIGAVITIPQRAILGPASPLVAKAIHEGNHEQSDKLYKQSSINQLIMGGVIFILIWINTEALYAMIPEKFSGGMWVVFYIGLSKLFIMGTGVSGYIIIFSKYYRVNLLFNLILIALTIITNYYLISSYGIVGAAIATAITFLVYNVIKIIYIYIKFNSLPFSASYFKTVTIILVTGIVGSNWDFYMDMPLLSIFVKSLFFSIALAISFYAMGVEAEILDLGRRLVKGKK